MANYFQYQFSVSDDAVAAELIAELSEIGFSGFEESSQILKAFIAESDFDEKVFIDTIQRFQIKPTLTVIPETNWNALWESNFEPVIVDDFVGIRADFHEPIAGVQYEIRITPKMSFGTGHHATTHMMMQLMRTIDFSNKTVFDFGTGTGVLAILAEKLGAPSIFAIDNDQWSIDNTQENIDRNQCKAIMVQLDVKPPIGNEYKVILANINKSVILEFLPSLHSILTKGGSLLLSGLLEEDKEDILAATSKLNLQLVDSQSRKGWIALHITK
jgi:ribosomal protein L11 methyltransferase